MALAALAVGELAIALQWTTDPGPTSHVRYLAAVATLCPSMAVLGCKRPQNRGWQFIVLSLLVILIVPSIEALLQRPGGPLRLHAARQWFLAVLIVVGLLNGLPTRQGWSSLLSAAGQVTLLIGHLPLVAVAWRTGGVSTPAQGLVGLGLWVAALVLLGWDLPRRKHVASPLDRLWLEFRDLFGVVWSLRVAERVNAASQMYCWGVRLEWSGLHVADAGSGHRPLSPDVEEAVFKLMRTLLRRFVSPEWIAARTPSQLANKKAPD